MSSNLARGAAEAVTTAGTYLGDRFADGTTEGEYTATDVKTRADREAESRALAVIEDRFPDHPISAEESGDHPGDGDYRWVVDALDGTNNFAAGIPTFGAAATALEGDDPIATAVHVPVLDDLYVAECGEGVRYNGRSVEVTDGETVPPEHATIGMIIGPRVVHGEQEQSTWDAISSAVDDVCKRQIQTWAPVVYWGLLARGKLDGFVCVHPAEREQAAGELLAREAGCIERCDGPLTVFGANEETCETLWNAAVGAR